CARSSRQLRLVFDYW
nr:immunoglobulin heavy chain junction region [Mus musculus]